MKNIVLFDTSSASQNMGDYIIMESARVGLREIIGGNFVVEAPTHSPVMQGYQINNHNHSLRYYDKADHKFICGTNLLRSDMMNPLGSWNVNIMNSRPYRGSVLLGVGLAQSDSPPNKYTKYLLGKILSRDYIHSTRDERTKVFLERLGYKATNTGCPTLWGLEEQFCKSIPRTKSKAVVFTLTDYSRDHLADRKMISILQTEYKDVFFWPQGSADYGYLRDLLGAEFEHIQIVSPTVDALRNVFKRGDIDYVGTRLHAGIFAMQNQARSMIISVDNRAADMSVSYDLNVTKREDIDSLGSIINSPLSTSIKLPHASISLWKAQFTEQSKLPRPNRM